MRVRGLVIVFGLAVGGLMAMCPAACAQVQTPTVRVASTKAPQIFNDSCVTPATVVTSLVHKVRSMYRECERKWRLREDATGRVECCQGRPHFFIDNTCILSSSMHYNMMLEGVVVSRSL